jgi:hypothetical protein
MFFVVHQTDFWETDDVTLSPGCLTYEFEYSFQINVGVVGDQHLCCGDSEL